MILLYFKIVFFNLTICPWKFEVVRDGRIYHHRIDLVDFVNSFQTEASVFNSPIEFNGQCLTQDGCNI